ncbi:MAG: hypothetical protein NT065_05385 [Chlamydiae bacterium]|nr:hypothetical protein [Chlamydiota bacterium]
MPISISSNLAVYLDNRYQKYENQTPTEQQASNASFALRSALVVAKIETVVGKCLHKVFEYIGIQISIKLRKTVYIGMSAIPGDP